MNDELTEKIVGVAKFGNDELSKFINNAWHNIKATWIEYNTIIQILNSINTLFIEYIEVFKILSKESDISSPTAFLARTYGCYLASVRLSTSGQFSESFVMFRACIETALYGYYINKKPESGKIWVERHKSNESKVKARKEFQIANIWKELAQQEPKICDWVKNTYDKSIDFGGHPNVYSFACNWRETDKGQVMDILNHDPYLLKNCLLANIRFGLGSLSILRLIYPKHLEDIDVPKKLKELFDKLNEQSQSN